MNFYLQLFEGPKLTQRDSGAATALLKQVAMKIGDAETVTVKVRNGNSAVDLPAGVEIYIPIKSGFADAAPLLMLASDFTRIGPGHYQTTMTSDIEALRTLFGSKARLTLYGELVLIDSEGNQSTTPTFAVLADNDLWKGDEIALPTTPSPESWVAGRIVAERQITLSINNLSGSSVTFNGVSCPDSATTSVGTVDPLNVAYSAPDGGTLGSQADAAVDIQFPSGANLGTSGTMALPYVTRPGSTVTLTIFGA